LALALLGIGSTARRLWLVRNVGITLPRVDTAIVVAILLAIRSPISVGVRVRRIRRILRTPLLFIGQAVLVAISAVGSGA